MANTPWYSNLFNSNMAGQLLSGGLNYFAGQNQQKTNTNAANNYMNNTKFVPFSVVSGMGSSKVNPYTKTATLSLSKPFQGLADDYTNIAGGINDNIMKFSSGDPVGEYYKRLTALRAPDNQQDRLDLENRLFSQGMLGSTGGGIRTNALLDAQGQQAAVDRIAAMNFAPDYINKMLLGSGAATGAATGLFQEPLKYLETGSNMGANASYASGPGASAQFEVDKNDPSATFWTSLGKSILSPTGAGGKILDGIFGKGASASTAGSAASAATGAFNGTGPLTSFGGTGAAGAAADPLAGILNPTGGTTALAGAGAVPAFTPGGASLISAGGPGMAPVYEGGTQALAGATPGSSVLGTIGSYAGPLAAMYGGVQAVKWLASDTGPFGTGGKKPLQEDLKHAVKSYGNKAPQEIFWALTGDKRASNPNMLQDTTGVIGTGKWKLLNQLTQTGMFDKSAIDAPLKISYHTTATTGYAGNRGTQVYQGPIWDFPGLYGLDTKATRDTEGNLTISKVTLSDKDRINALTSQATELAGGKDKVPWFLQNIIAKSKNPDYVRIAKLALKGGTK